MSSRGCQLFVGVLFSVTLILLTISVISFILSIRSHYRVGLEDSLCKCEHLHGNQKKNMIKPRIVNGTAFTKSGLSWVASIYVMSMYNSSSKEPTAYVHRCTGVRETVLICQMIN